MFFFLKPTSNRWSLANSTVKTVNTMFGYKKRKWKKNEITFQLYDRKKIEEKENKGVFLFLYLIEKNKTKEKCMFIKWQKYSKIKMSFVLHIHNRTSIKDISTLFYNFRLKHFMKLLLNQYIAQYSLSFYFYFFFLLCQGV